MKPEKILKLENELKIEINLSSNNDFFDLDNKNTYDVNSNNEVVSLNLQGNKIINISFLKEFKKLEKLDIRNNPIRNKKPLEHLKLLTLLGVNSITSNNIEWIKDFIKDESSENNVYSCKIVAVYIQEHEYLFNQPQIINFGGQNIYDIQTSDKNSVELTCKLNSNYIENFFGEDISLVTAIVGENGAGKTTLLTKLYNQLVPVHFGDEKTVFFIVEENEKIKYYLPFNSSKEFKIKSNNFNIEETSKELQAFPIYYSNYLSENKIYKDKSNSLDLSFMNQILNDINSEVSNFSSNFSFSIHNNAKLKRWMTMLSNPIITEALNEYSLPVFEKIRIEIQKNVIVNGKNNIRILKNLNYPNVKDLKNEVAKVIELFNKIELLPLDSYGSEFTYSKTISFLMQQMMLFISDIIFMQEMKIYPKIKNFDDFIKLEELKNPYEIFNLFIKNFYFVDINNKESEIIFPFQLFNDFLSKFEEIIKKNDAENDISNIIMDFNSSNSILELYQNIYIQLNKSFKFDNHQLIRFFPDIIISSGEEMVLNLISLLYQNKEVNVITYLPKILFLDEADLGLHPNWKKKYINTLIKILPKIFIGMNLQIIFTTHDPLTLSDIPNSNIVYLKKENGKTEVLKEDKRPQKSFGANITDLLADSFFIEDGLIGDFAKSKINDVLNDLLSKKKVTKKRQSEIKKIINIIDEPIIKMKLEDLYREKFSEILDKENRIIELLDELKKLQG